MRKENSSSETHFHTLYAPSTCIVQKSLEPKQPISHDVTKAAGHNKQEGEWACGPAAVPGFMDQRDGCEGGTKPMHPNSAVGGPALVSLIVSPHDIACVAEWHLHRYVLDIVTFCACQASFYAVISHHQLF